MAKLNMPYAKASQYLRVIFGLNNGQKWLDRNPGGNILLLVFVAVLPVSADPCLTSSSRKMDAGYGRNFEVHNRGLSCPSILHRQKQVSGFDNILIWRNNV